MLNTAAYLFQGVTLEKEVTENEKIDKNIKGSLGFKFLQDLISPVSLSGEKTSENIISSKSARTYTLGGLHMSVLEELTKHEQLKDVTFSPLSVPENTFVSLNVILKPVDFYQIIEVINLIKPLIIQLLTDFGSKINKETFTEENLNEIPKYDKLFEAIISSIENDYLRSKQLEMLMIDPDSKEIVGIVDIEVSSDIEPLEIKAKLNDGEFQVIGKVSRYVEEGESISMVQRTVLSKILDLVTKAMAITSTQEKLINYHMGVLQMKAIVENFIQLTLNGPAVRVIAMSINV